MMDTKIIRRATLLICIILIPIAFLIYEDNFSQRAVIGKRNHINALKLLVGMPKDSVLNIMGTPDTFFSTHYDNVFVEYIYESNNGDYLPIRISFDKDNNIVKVTNID